MVTLVNPELLLRDLVSLLQSLGGEVNVSIKAENGKVFFEIKGHIGQQEEAKPTESRPEPEPEADYEADYMHDIIHHEEEEPEPEPEPEYYYYD